MFKDSIIFIDLVKERNTSALNFSSFTLELTSDLYYKYISWHQHLYNVEKHYHTIDNSIEISSQKI